MPSKKFSTYNESVKWLTKNNLRHEAFESIDSTNGHAKKMATNGESEKYIYLARTQTAGRGRGTNTWLDSQNEDSLLATWSMSLPSIPQPITSPLLGLAVFNALVKTWSVPIRMKAPNDLLFNNKKFCGILTESLSVGSNYRLMVGIGLNVFSAPEDISEATHLSAFTNALDEKSWSQFLTTLNEELSIAGRASQGIHLTVLQREEILSALNHGLSEDHKYVSVSPFGDLSSSTQTVSWRDL